MKSNRFINLSIGIIIFGVFALNAQTNNRIMQIDSSKIRIINKQVYRVFQKKFIAKKVNQFKTDSTEIRYKKITLSTIFFKQSKKQILSESIPKLEQVLVMLKDNPELKISINGYADRLGNRRSNLILSRARTRVIKRYFKRGGVISNRISSVGFGDRYPICSPPCKENRRVEFLLDNTTTSVQSKI